MSPSLQKTIKKCGDLSYKSFLATSLTQYNITAVFHSSLTYHTFLAERWGVWLRWNYWVVATAECCCDQWDLRCL